MKVLRSIVFLMGIICFLGVDGAQKPSAWQKFKSVFSSKKSAPQEETAVKQENVEIKEKTSPAKQSFLNALSQFRKSVTKFQKFCRAHMKMIQVKIKTLKIVQDEIDKTEKKINRDKNKYDPAQKKIGMAQEKVTLTKSKIARLSKAVGDISEKLKNMENNRIKYAKDLDSFIKEKDALTRQSKLLIEKELPLLNDELVSSTEELERLKKEIAPMNELMKQKDHYMQQAARLRADFFVALVEIFIQAKPVLISVRNVISRGKPEGEGMIDDIIKKMNDIINEGDTIGDMLLRASKAIGALDISEAKQYSGQMNKYFESVVRIVSDMKGVTEKFGGVLQLATSALVIANMITFGALSTYTAFAYLINEVTMAVRSVSALSKDIVVNVIEVQRAEKQIETIAKDVNKVGEKFDDESKSDELFWEEIGTMYKTK